MGGDCFAKAGCAYLERRTIIRISRKITGGYFMGLAEEYRKRLATPEQAVRVVKSGDWVEYGQFATQNVLLDKALAARKDELKDVKVRSTTRVGAMPEVVRVDPTAEHFRYNSMHYMGVDRRSQELGNCWYIPILYHEVPSWYRNYMDLDVAMIATTTMDEHGYFNFGPSCSFSRAICDKAKKIVLEVNPNIPRCLGGREESVHISEVDYIVEADWPFPEVPISRSHRAGQKDCSLDRQRNGGRCLPPDRTGWYAYSRGMDACRIRPAGPRHPQRNVLRLHAGND